jgi:dGTPase
MGDSHSKRIHALVMGILEATEPGTSDHVAMEEERYAALVGLRDFMYERVYLHPTVTRELDKAKSILRLLWDALTGNEPLRRELVGAPADERAVADFLAGMTDAYAVSLHERLHIPNRWYHG